MKHLAYAPKSEQPLGEHDEHWLCIAAGIKSVVTRLHSDINSLAQGTGEAPEAPRHRHLGSQGSPSERARSTHPAEMGCPSTALQASGRLQDFCTLDISALAFGKKSKEASMHLRATAHGLQLRELRLREAAALQVVGGRWGPARLWRFSWTPLIPMAWSILWLQD